MEVSLHDYWLTIGEYKSLDAMYRAYQVQSLETLWS